MCRTLHFQARRFVCPRLYLYHGDCRQGKDRFLLIVERSGEAARGGGRPRFARTGLPSTKRRNDLPLRRTNGGHGREANVLLPFIKEGELARNSLGSLLFKQADDEVLKHGNLLSYNS